MFNTLREQDEAVTRLNRHSIICTLGENRWIAMTHRLAIEMRCVSIDDHALVMRLINVPRFS
jgi:hypothetical protein